MTIFERIDRFRRVWELAVPQFACPDEAQIFRWAGRFDDDALDYGLRRVGAKVVKGAISSPDAAARYLTGVLLNEENARQEIQTQMRK